MPRETGRKVIAQNKRARHEYFIEDTYEAGLVLTGTEVKSLREGRANLTDGFAAVENDEAWLYNVHIPEYTQGTWTNHSAKRKRKLLLHRKEIGKINATLKEKGLTLIPWPSTSRTAGPRSRSASPGARRTTTSARPYVRSRTTGICGGPCRAPSGARGAARRVSPVVPCAWHSRSPSSHPG